MSARHATRHHAAHDPLGRFLGWLWVLGTVIGLVTLATAVDSRLANRGALGPTLTTPDLAVPDL
ncbi:hypothetical protein [Streptomyces sp. NPDC001415]